MPDKRARHTSMPWHLAGPPVTRDELLSLALLVMGFLSCLLMVPGALFGHSPAPLLVVFGWGALPFAAALAAGGMALLAGIRHGWEPRWWAVVAGECLFLSLLALSHLGIDGALAVALDGGRGGLVGWAISELLLRTVGLPLARGLIAAAAGAAVWFLWRTLPSAWTSRVVAVVQRQIPRLLLMLPQPAPPVDETPSAVEKPRRSRKRKDSSAEQEMLPAVSGIVDVPTPDRARRQPKAGKQKSDSARAGRRKARADTLPPLDLLKPVEAPRAHAADTRQRAQILKQTLLEFGVPVEVVSIKEGPTVTQFGLEPGEIVRESKDGEIQRRRVSVNRIMRLSNDLALALAASSIRIEAPVPGQSYVGVEIPNAETSLVGLRTVLESKEFARASVPLTIALGRDVSGDPVVADLTRMPHLLIAGATGSGKSVCINTIVCSLLMSNGPETLRLLMVDPKMVELPAYNGIPHLLAPVVTDVSQATGALTWLAMQMDDRYQAFNSAGVRNIEEYNRQLGKARRSEMLPYIVLVIDELADLMMTAAYDVERQICRLAQMARATGIHLILATQRPSVDVITGLIKANFPARIAFAVTTQTDSRVILDSPGAERLLGRGDMLFMLPDSPKLSRVQGCFVSDAEIDRIVDFWKATTPEGESPANVPWMGLLEQTEGRDDMLERALDLIRTTSHVSASLLQRRLRIGFPRAARLMEQLEDLGMVGPDEGAGRGREVLLDEEDEEEVEVDP